METAKAEDATEYLSNAIKDHIGKSSSKWSRHEWADVDRIVKASVYSVLKEGTGPGDVKRILSSIKSGYGCWLDMVEKGFQKAVADVPDNVKEQFMQVYGSFKMAQMFLFDIEKNRKAQSNGNGKKA